MALFSLFFLLISSAFSMEFSRYIKSSENNLLQKFVFDSDQVVFQKRTNFYDTKKDWRVGVMQPVKEKTEKERLAGLLKKIRESDSFLRKNNQTFNDLTGDPLHSAHWILDEFRLKDTSLMNSELARSFEALQNKNWKLKDGVELSSDGKNMRTVTNGKAGPYTALTDKDCKMKDTVKICVFRPHGVLYVR